MCGIAGFTHRKHPVDGWVIRGIARSIHHRGPDQHGVYETDDVSLAVVRLRIIDLEGGHQPMFSDDADTIIVFNGEIYNHAELRGELEHLGHRFESHCDTEVVLRAFLEWDLDCFPRLRGMFAVALWTESEKRLVLCRDRLGIKPLYLYHRGHELYFGSELKTILGHREAPRSLDVTGLGYYLSLNYVPCPHTLVEGVTKLPPAHWLEWRDGVERSEAYWQPRFEPSGKWSLESAKERLDELLRSSVREHLISDVPLGIWASGGLDSSTVLHYAAEASAHRLKTFSVSFNGRSFDESPFFRQIASIYGTDHHELDLHPGAELESAIEDFAWYSDEPSADAGALPVWFLSKMCREHVTVALSGEGADELFGGYLTYAADNVARLLRAAPDFARRFLSGALARYCPVSDDKIGLEYKLKRLLEGSTLPPDAAHFFWNGTFSERQKRDLCPGLPLCGPPELARHMPLASEVGYLNRYLAVDQAYYLPDDILYKVDRMSMAHSLEVRPPFLDHRIVEFSQSLPQRLKIRGGTQKYLLKQLMRDKLPPCILQRKKIGFDIPAHDWFRGVLRPLLLDTLSDSAIQSAGIFDSSAIRTLIGDHMERRANVGYHLWGLLTLFLWMKRWRIETPPLRDRRADRVPVFASR